MTEDKMTEVKGKEKKKKRDLPVLKIVQEDPASCFVQLSNKMNSSKIDPTEMSVSDIPIEVLSEIRHLVQLLGDPELMYKSTALTLLEALMMKYPVLAPCVANNVMYIYSKKFSKDHMSKDKKLSKMMGLGCIIRSGTVFRNTPLLMRIVSEILLNRVGSDRDDMDVFFLLSSLQHNESVPAISEIILASMESELSVFVSEMKLSTLWLRVGLAQRMIVTGVRMPEYLRQTFLPHNVQRMGAVLMPHSKRNEPQHPAFETLVHSLASYHKHWQKFKSNQKGEDKAHRRPNPVVVLLTTCIGPFIRTHHGDPTNLQNVAICYKLLENIITTPHMDGEIMDSLVTFMCRDVDCLPAEVKKMLLEGIINQCDRLLEDEKTSTDEKDKIVMCLIKGSQGAPSFISIVGQRIHYLSAETARNTAETLLGPEGKQLTEADASLILRLIASNQLSEEDYSEWRLRMARKITYRALMKAGKHMRDTFGEKEEEGEKEKKTNEEGRILSQEEFNDIKENKQKQKGFYCFIDKKAFLYRFLNTVAQNKRIYPSVFREAHNCLLEHIKEDDFPMRDEIKETWVQISNKLDALDKCTEEEFKYKHLFHMMLLQFSLDYVKAGSKEYSIDLVSDLLTCLDKAIEENEGVENEGVAIKENEGVEGSEQKEPKTASGENDDEPNDDDEPKTASGENDDNDENDDDESPSDWRLVMVDILMAVAAKEEFWWRTILKPAGKVLAKDLSTECLDTVIDVLLRDDAVKSKEYDSSDDEEKGENEDNEQKKNDDNDDDEMDTAQSDAEEEMDDEDDKVEDSDEDESEDSDISDESDDEKDDSEDSDESDEEEFDAGQRENMISKLQDVMGGIAMTNEEEQDLDMDTMPKAEMEEMDRNLAQIFLYYKEQRALRKLKVKTAGIDSELMEYRNRILDFMEGVVDGSPDASTLLTHVTLPLLQVLRFHDPKKFTAMASRVTKILKTIRTKKPDGIEKMTEKQLLDGLSEVFSYVKHFPECYYGAIVILKYSKALFGEGCNPVLDSYIDNISGLIGKRLQYKAIIIDVINIEVPHLRKKLLDCIISEVFSSVGEGQISLIPDSWDLLEKVLERVKACGKLTDEEKEIFRVIGKHIETYFSSCKQPAKKIITPLTQIVKMVKKDPDWNSFFDWSKLGESFRKFRTLDACKKKNFRKELDRLGTLLLKGNLVNKQAKFEMKKERREMKRKRQEEKSEKMQKRRKLENERKQQFGDENLFAGEDKCMDANDPDFKIPGENSQMDVPSEKKNMKHEEAQMAREKLREKMRARKARNKANQKKKREEYKKLKEEYDRCIAENEEPPQLPEKPTSKKQAPKQKPVPYDKKINSALKSGVFSGALGLNAELK